MEDMNDPSSSPILCAIEDAGFKDAWWNSGLGYGSTFHDNRFRLRIDHIFYDNHFELCDIRVLHTNYSDHNTLIGTFNLKNKNKFMPKLFQINIVSNMLSTGKICEDIAKVVVAHGWESYIAYGRWANPGISIDRRVGGQIDMYEHFIEHRLFDNEGLASRRATKKLIRWIDEVKPDIIQLHNIHDHYLNYPLLFRYLAVLNTPVVWVQHDCWAFTGGCVYSDLYNCEKWREGCNSQCPNNRAMFGNKSEKQYALKREVFSQIKNLTLISVSDWLRGLLKESFLNNKRIITIHNGIDISRFKPASEIREVKECKDSAKSEKYRILGVAAVWDARKGLSDFIKLRSILSGDFDISLVGLTQKQIDVLPAGIKGITRTSNIEDLVQLYSDADVYVNPTYSDNFPTTNIEALACGTPVITYRTGGAPEAIDTMTGIVINQGDIVSLANAIVQMKDNPLSSADCRKRVKYNFDKDKCFEKYVQLYEELLLKQQ